jgi:LuxR family transcriptional regulator of spore coat protein
MPLCLDEFYRLLPDVLEARTNEDLTQAWLQCCDALDIADPVLEAGSPGMASAAAGGPRHSVSAPTLGPGAVTLSYAATAEAGPPASRLEAAQAMLVFAIGRTLGQLRIAGVGQAALSPREADCLAWVARGKTNWEIGRIIGVGARTVQFHVSNAARKLGVEGRHQAAQSAAACGALSGYPVPRAAPARGRESASRPWRRGGEPHASRL